MSLSPEVAAVIISGIAGIAVAVIALVPSKKNSTVQTGTCPVHVDMVKEITTNGVLLGAISNRLECLEEKHEKTGTMILEIYNRTVRDKNESH